MFGEESPAGNPSEVIGRRELAILGDRYTQHGFELSDAAGSPDSRLQLTLRRAPPDAVIRSCNQTRFALMALVEFRYVQNAGGTVRLASANLSNQLQAVRDDDGVELRADQTNR